MKGGPVLGRRKLRQGMVLFELMLALFVFITVAFALVLALDAAMKAGRERDEIADVVGGLANQMALLHSGQLVPADKDLPDDGSGIRYRLVIEPAQFQDQKKQPLPGIYRVTITAKWKFDGQAEDRSVSEWIYQP